MAEDVDWSVVGFEEPWVKTSLDTRLGGCIHAWWNTKKRPPSQAKPGDRIRLVHMPV